MSVGSLLASFIIGCAICANPNRQEFDEEHIRVLAMSKQSNHLWIGTNRGVVLLDNIEKCRERTRCTIKHEKCNRARPPEALWIQSIAVDDFGRLWIGTPTGVYRSTETKSAGNCLGAEWSLIADYRIDAMPYMPIGKCLVVNPLQLGFLSPARSEIQPPFSDLRAGFSVTSDYRGRIWITKPSETYQQHSVFVFDSKKAKLLCKAVLPVGFIADSYRTNYIPACSSTVADIVVAGMSSIALLSYDEAQNGVTYSLTTTLEHMATLSEDIVVPVHGATDKPYAKRNSLSFRSICTSPAGKVLGASDTGLASIPLQSVGWEEDSWKSQKAILGYYSVSVDPVGRVWTDAHIAATKENGNSSYGRDAAVCCVADSSNLESNHVYFTHECLGSDTVTVVLAVSNKELWIGTLGGKVVYFNHNGTIECKSDDTWIVHDLGHRTCCSK
jgi:hypothetical protein